MGQNKHYPTQPKMSLTGKVSRTSTRSVQQVRNLFASSPYRETKGPMGRHANGGMTATCFGGYGYIGSYIMNELGSCGITGYAPFRGCEMEVRHLKPMFDVGNLGLLPFSPRDEASIAKSLSRSDVVINCIGSFRDTHHIVPTRRANGEISRVNYSMEESNIEIPRRLARIARENGVKTFVHISALSAKPNSASRFSRTKYYGELAVLEEFPNAIIVRPADVFGHEDSLLNGIAWSLIERREFFLYNEGKNLMQPVLVTDVAEAVLNVIRDYTKYEGKTIHLAGTAEYTYKEIVEFVADFTGKLVNFYDVPFFLANALGQIATYFPNPIYTPDTLARYSEDNYIHEADADKVLTFKNLGMSPSSMDRVCFEILSGFRDKGHFQYSEGYRRALQTINPMRNNTVRPRAPVSGIYTKGI